MRPSSLNMIASYTEAIRARMSSTRHAVTRGPSFTGLGYFPDLQPAHHDDLLTGITAGMPRLASPMIVAGEENRFREVGTSGITSYQ